MLSAERVHGDDTPVPGLAKGKTDTGRIYVYVRDDKPFNGPAPPGAVFYYSRDRSGKHPQAHLANYSGVFHYMLKRRTAFTRFLDDGRICLSNNAAERGVRGIALGRKSWLFCGSDRCGERAAISTA